VAAGPFTPDHLVYARAFPLTAGVDRDAVSEYRDTYGYLPKVVSLDGQALLTVGASLRGARATLTAARDAALVQQLAAAFGGPRYLSEAARRFIEDWEVESYRKMVSAGAGPERRAENRVCVVTGGAQGFGLGIARGLAAEGAIVGIADLNGAGARDAAVGIEREHGPGRAFAVAVDISDEASVAAMVREVVLECGGVDLFVANAGVLKAGAVTEMPLTDWQFVTGINYTGYFLCVKCVAPVMARQNHGAGRNCWTDIVQINSKSGLEGSNRNAAYAGSKFGTIGLTKSFAKELIPDRIKVNSICPGNFYDGPLWSDPERGLFVQYLNAGKVPGAKTIADVRAYYEAQTPMGRGCTPGDVVRAILYAMEQDYETGQAIPVTGGQVMLR
jgi:NAD(P)-dependent dehydrogenase (short-subunit alcohol dehydrogenase family)